MPKKSPENRCRSRAREGSGFEAHLNDPMPVARGGAIKNVKLDTLLLLALMWASFVAFAQVSSPLPVTVAAVTPSVWTEAVVIALISSFATTFVAIATLIVGVLNTRSLKATTEKVDTVIQTVAEVKKATDGMTTALVENAAERGRKEGADLAAAGAAAVTAPSLRPAAEAAPVPVVETPNVKKS